MKLLLSVQITDDEDVAREMMLATLQNGKALEKFEEMLIYQGVSRNVANSIVHCHDENIPYLPKSKMVTELTATASGLC